MRRAAGCLLLLGSWACADATVSEEARPLTEDVNVFVGTGGIGFGVGSIPPSPTVPFGLAKPAPDTSSGGAAPGFSHCGGYWYEDDEVRAFSQLHLVGTGIADYGVLGIMPVTALEDGPFGPHRYRAAMDHAQEKASVGWYQLKLAPSGIGVEISATAHTSLYRMTYPDGAAQGLVIDLAHGLGNGKTVDGLLELDAAKGEASGWLHHKGDFAGRYGGIRVYFAMRFDRPFASYEAVQGTLRMPSVATATGARAGAVVWFGPASSGSPVRVQIGLSFIDTDTARRALESEWMAFDLERARDAVIASWEPLLAQIQVEGGSAKDRRKLYTALYHVYQMPTLFTEDGGRYRGHDGEVHVADGFTYYSDFSLWDTFRTFHPLITLLRPDLATDFSRSLIAMDEQGSERIKWPLATGETGAMIGNHVESVLADAWIKGARGFDVERIYGRLADGALRGGAGGAYVGRDCWESYAARGYCAADEGSGSTSRTLENAFNDFVLGQLALALGKQADGLALMARSGSWEKLYNPATGFIQGRKADGSFIDGFRPDLFAEDLVEGNARQWGLFVPHDVDGLAQVMGGRDKLVARVNELFEGAAMAEKTFLPDLWYWHGNEPDIHAAYMPAEIGRPDLTAKWVKWIRDARYADNPAGLDGNDDGGTLSAWYVFSALGIYPKVAEPRYVLGTPIFDRATITLPSGAKVVITSEGASLGPYVQSVTVNGAAIEGPYVAHGALTQGADLHFVLGASPR